MMRFTLALILALSAAASAQTTRPFVVYDNLESYTGKPDTAKIGFQRNMTSSVLVTADGTQPDEAKCRKFGKDAAALGAGTLAVIDIEHWPADIRKHPPEQVADSVAKLIQATAWVRAGAAETSTPILVSHYALPVIRDYWTPVINKPDEIAKLKAANDALRPLAAVCDAICPSLYSFYEGESGWMGNWHKFASFSVGEATRLGGGKPVVPFVWWRWHSSNDVLGDHYKDSVNWQRELKTLRGWKRVDGLILWDWAGFNDRFEGTGKRIYKRAWPQSGWVLWTATLEELT